MGKVGARNDTDAYMVDKGCRVHPACLSCPLERCIYDTPRGKSVVLTRQQQAVNLRNAGHNRLVIAAQLRCTPNYVSQMLRQAKREQSIGA